MRIATLVKTIFSTEKNYCAILGTGYTIEIVLVLSLPNHLIKYGNLMRIESNRFF